MISEIAIKNVLPEVFAGDGEEKISSQSQVWLHYVTFHKGETYTVAARSGAGKSSLCSFIYGNRTDYIGEITFDGHNIKTFDINFWCELRRKSLSYLPQEMMLFPELTLLENIRIKNDITHHKSEQQIAALAERLGLEAHLQKKAAHLSVGQQQRAAAIRAVCQPFDFIILDEPVSHLDEENNHILAEIITEEAASQGAGIITTSVGNSLALSNPIILTL